MKLEHGFLADEAERNVILYRHPSQQNRKKENIYIYDEPDRKLFSGL